MAARTSFGKRERERNKKAKAEAKRDRRQENAEKAAEEAALANPGDLSAAQILDLLDKVQAEFDREDIDFEEYEERKMELLSQLPLD